MTRILPNGMGQPEPDRLGSRGPVFMSGQVWYVNSATGADAASPRGLTEEYPLATLGQAVTNAASNDVIVLMSGHTETIASTVTVTSKNLIILGGGTSSGKPTVKLTNNVLSSAMLSVASTSLVRLRNIWFPEPAGAATSPTVTSSGSCYVDGCYFECGANNGTGAYGLHLNSLSRVEGTTWISVATSKTARPERGLFGTTAMAGELQEITFDGGTYGWDSYAMELQAPAAFGFTIEMLSLLRGSDALIAATANGILQLDTVTGGSRVNW